MKNVVRGARVALAGLLSVVPMGGVMVLSSAAVAAGMTVTAPRSLNAEDSLVGKALPAFSFSEVPAAEGQAAGTIDSKAVAGKWLVIDFLLQTDCPICAKRVLDYADSLGKIQNDKTALILIKPDEVKSTQAWMAARNVTGAPIYRDADAGLAKALALPDGYKFHGAMVHYPATIIVSPEGKIVWANVATATNKRVGVDEVIKALDELRNKPAAGDGGAAKPGDTTMAKAGDSVLGFTVKDIDGKDVELKKYEGKVFLVVNVASKCGLTPQYEQLEAIYKKYNDQGFEILGFPANNFGSQEPGTEADIKQFCSSKYSVTFPMFTKMSVKGADISPLYDWLVNKQPNTKLRGEIAWNFNKFLVNKKGEVIARFEPKTKPDAPEVIKAVEAALAEK